jgi:hypothetical protein
LFRLDGFFHEVEVAVSLGRVDGDVGDFKGAVDVVEEVAD